MGECILTCQTCGAALVATTDANRCVMTPMCERCFPKLLDAAKGEGQTAQAKIDAQQAEIERLRARVDKLESGLRLIAVWSQEEQDDRDICVLQWRGCVAIARELLKSNVKAEVS
jgi:hypothetical protein